jgi:DNA repair exonuclease SbcCD ATPase subunit
MVVPLVAFTLGTGGCLVTTSKYEAKTVEADSLRDALAAASKEKNTLEARYESAQKQLSDAEKENMALSSRNRELEEELGSVKEELASIAGKYEGTRITREELISELLEKEKATGKRIQELGEMGQQCDRERERLQRESVETKNTISALEKRIAETADNETLRRERDILLGRIERIKEERLQEARRRDSRFAELAKTFSGISSRIESARVGPAMVVRVPDTVLFRKGKSTVSSAGKKVVQEVGNTATEFPAAAIIITAGEKSKAEEIRTLLTKTHSLSRERVNADTGSGARVTELLLVIP